MEATHIGTCIEDNIGFITLDRPERFNSLDVRTAQDLRRAGLAMARDSHVRVVVLSGVNGVFCSGADLKYIRAGGEPADLAYLTPEGRETPSGYGERFKQILEYLHSAIAEIRHRMASLDQRRGKELPQGFVVFCQQDMCHTRAACPGPTSAEDLIELRVI